MSVSSPLRGVRRIPVRSVEVELRESLTELPDITPHFCVLNSSVQGDSLLTSMTTVLDSSTTSLLYSLDPSCSIHQAYIGDRGVAYRLVSQDDQSATWQIHKDEQQTTEGPVSVTLMYRQPLTERRALFSRILPAFPAIVGGSGLVNGIWIIGQGAGNTVLQVGGGLNELNSRPIPFLTDGSSQLSSQVSSLLSPYPENVRSAVKRHIQNWLIQADESVLLAGQIHKSTPHLLIIPQHTLLLAIATFGLIIYLVFARLSGISFVTVLVVLIASLLALSAVSPGTAYSLSSKLLPGGVLAVIAAFLHRFFASTPVARPTKTNTSDETTIFTFDQLPDATATSASEIASTALTS